MTDYKSERDSLIADIAKLRAERDELSKKLDEYCNVSLNIEGQLVEILKERDEYKQKVIYISNQYSTEIEQALNNKDLNESLFLLEKLKMDLDEVLKNDTR